MVLLLACLIAHAHVRMSFLKVIRLLVAIASKPFQQACQSFSPYLLKISRHNFFFLYYLKCRLHMFKKYFVYIAFFLPFFLFFACPYFCLHLCSSLSMYFSVCLIVSLSHSLFVNYFAPKDSCPCCLTNSGTILFLSPTQQLMCQKQGCGSGWVLPGFGSELRGKTGSESDPRKNYSYPDLDPTEY